MNFSIRIVAAGSVALLVASCASGPKGTSRNTDLTIAIGEANVRVGEQTFEIRDAEAMRAGLAGACANGCERVEIRAIPTARYDAMLASYSAAVDNAAGAIQLRIAASKPVPMVPGDAGRPDADCPAEIVLGKKAIHAYVQGEALPPDNQCETWGATVCDSGTQDPLKKAEFARLGEVVRQNSVRFKGQTCVYAESEMPALLLNGLISTVQDNASREAQFSLRRLRRKGRLSEKEVTDAIVAQGELLTSCYNTELETTRTPMSLVARVLIGPDGKVARFATRDPHHTTPRFEQCIETAFGSMTFPKPDHGAHFEMNYPLSFSPK